MSSVMEMGTREHLLRRSIATPGHSIDRHGVVTKGVWGPPNPFILQAFNTIDFRGKGSRHRLLGRPLVCSRPRSAGRPRSMPPTHHPRVPEQPTLLLPARPSVAHQVRPRHRRSTTSAAYHRFVVFLFTSIYYHREPPPRVAQPAQVVGMEALILKSVRSVAGSSPGTTRNYVLGERSLSQDELRD